MEFNINDKVIFNDKRTGDIQCWVTAVHHENDSDEPTHLDLVAIEQGYNIMHVPVRHVKKVEP